MLHTLEIFDEKSMSEKVVQEKGWTGVCEGRNGIQKWKSLKDFLPNPPMLDEEYDEIGKRILEWDREGVVGREGGRDLKWNNFKTDLYFADLFVCIHSWLFLIYTFLSFQFSMRTYLPARRKENQIAFLIIPKQIWDFPLWQISLDFVEKSVKEEIEMGSF